MKITAISVRRFLKTRTTEARKEREEHAKTMENTDRLSRVWSILYENTHDATAGRLVAKNENVSLTGQTI